MAARRASEGGHRLKFPCPDGISMRPPAVIDGYKVVEFGFFPAPILPTGYIPHPDGRPPLLPVQNLALCTADGIDGYYLLFCAPDWSYVTCSFDETVEYSKRTPLNEFGQDVVEWHRFDRTSILDDD